MASAEKQHSTEKSSAKAADDYLRSKAEGWRNFGYFSDGVWVTSLFAGFVATFNPLVWVGIGAGLVGSFVGMLRRRHFAKKM